MKDPNYWAALGGNKSRAHADWKIVEDVVSDSEYVGSGTRRFDVP